MNEVAEVAELRRRRPRTVAARRGMSLSPREYQVLAALASGASYEDIGAKLYITLDTVKSHLKRIFVKLGAKNGVHAVSLGYQLGILTIGDDAA